MITNLFHLDSIFKEKHDATRKEDGKTVFNEDGARDRFEDAY